MTNQEIQDFFSVNYGVKRPPDPKKRSCGLYFVCLICGIAPLVILLIWDGIQKGKVAAFHAEVARRAKSYPQMYDEHIQNYISSNNLEQKALDKCDLEKDQIITDVAPVLIHGQKYDKGTFWKTNDGVTRTSKQTFTYIFFAEKDARIYELTYDFFNNKASESDERILYKHITNIKTNDTVVEVGSGDEKEEIAEHRLSVITAGDRFDISVISQGPDLERSIRSMKNKLVELQG